MSGICASRFCGVFMRFSRFSGNFQVFSEKNRKISSSIFKTDFFIFFVYFLKKRGKKKKSDVFRDRFLFNGAKKKIRQKEKIFVMLLTYVKNRGIIITERDLRKYLRKQRLYGKAEEKSKNLFASADQCVFAYGKAQRQDDPPRGRIRSVTLDRPGGVNAGAMCEPNECCTGDRHLDL